MLGTSLKLEAEKRQAASAISVKPKTDGETLILGTPTRAIWVGGTGSLICTFADGTSATFENVPGGQERPWSVVSIAGTATNVVAMF